MRRSRTVLGISRNVLYLLAAVLPAPPSVLGQQLSEVEADTLEEIIVTGSRIPRNRDFVSTSPLTTIDKLEFRLTGTTNVEDTLNTLPQVTPDLGRFSNNAGNGSATVNLRGLGANRSLVLLNGRRFISFGVDGAVDLNNFPPALLDRVEIVTGGASAVYGSDALTGAVNFITRDAFEGLEVGAQYDVTDRGDGDVIDVNVAGGLGFLGDRGHVSGFLNYNDRDSIFQSKRSFATVELFENIFTGELLPSGSVRNPAGTIPDPVTVGGEPAPDGITFNRDGTPRPFRDPEDQFNFAPFNYLQVPQERLMAAMFADLDLNKNSRLYSELMFVDNEVALELAPTLNARFVQVNLDNPFVTPELRQVLVDFFDPDADGIAEFILEKRFLEFGSRMDSVDTDVYRAVFGYDANIGETWRVDAYLSYSKSDRVDTSLNEGLLSRLRQSLLVDPVTGQCFDTRDGCQPANVFGEENISPEAAGFILAPPLVFETDIEQTIFGASTVGDLVALPDGELSVAAGIEIRDEQFGQTSGIRDVGTDLLGSFASRPVSGEYDLKEVFVELYAPLLDGRPFARYLAIEGGYRYTDHSIAGSFDSWKLSAEWEPFEGVRFRGSRQQAVRAPNIDEYFAPEITEINSTIAEFADLCSASFMPIEAGLTDVCIAQGIPAPELGVYKATPFFPTMTTIGGNPALDPEESETITAGLVLQPRTLPGLQLSIDYYSIEIDNAIEGVGPFDTALLCFAINNPDEPMCQAIERDSVSFNISSVTGGPRNVARLRTEGFDLQLSLDHELPRSLALFDGAASLRWWFLGNHTTEHGVQETPAIDFRDCAGNFGFPCDTSSFGTLPEFKTRTRVTYFSGPLSLSFQWRWIDGMENAFLVHGLDLFGIPRDQVNFAVPAIGNESYYALSFDYAINDTVTMYGGINNLTDNDPPILGGAAGAANTDPSTYDVYGRRYFLGVTARFGN